mmetsp:Transcript_51331/g.121643  ORF Transcript_51331/g.121643 Transcript_51331/m.121643 type:complete len:209 (+) Transcript_51331:2494-3120(+)
MSTRGMTAGRSARRRGSTTVSANTTPFATASPTPPTPPATRKPATLAAPLTSPTAPPTGPNGMTRRRTAAGGTCESAGVLVTTGRTSTRRRVCVWRAFSRGGTLDKGQARRRRVPPRGTRGSAPATSRRANGTPRPLVTRACALPRAGTGLSRRTRRRASNRAEIATATAKRARPSRGTGTARGWTLLSRRCVSRRPSRTAQSAPKPP